MYVLLKVFNGRMDEKAVVATTGVYTKRIGFATHPFAHNVVTNMHNPVIYLTS
jgi:hypothetical protein